MLKEANEKIARLRCAADLLVAAEFWGENAKDKMERVRHAAVVSGHYVEKGPTEEFEEKAANERRGQTMFHWPLEFPEVIVKRGGFDAFVGNPPFQGGAKLGGTLNDSYRDYLVDWLGGGERGRRRQTDLCAFMFCRAAANLNVNGVLGLLATNTIAQGDTRKVGLDRLVEHGCIIFRAISSEKWPGTANLEVAVVWLSKRPWFGVRLLDGQSVKQITPYLTAGGDIQGSPDRLAANLSHSSEGIRVEGTGFVLSGDEALALISNSDKNRAVLRRFLSSSFAHFKDKNPS